MSAASAVSELQALARLPRRQAADAKRPIGASLDLAIPTSDGGLFLAGWLHDPHALAAELVVRTPFGGERRVERFAHRFPREDVAKLYGGTGIDRSGFVLHLPGTPEPAEALQVTAELRLASGGALRLVPPPRPRAHADARAAVLGSLPPRFATPELLETVIGPAVVPLHAAHLATRTRDEWCVLMEGSDACVAPVLDMDEAPEHPHNRARGTFIEVGGVIQPAPAPRFSRSTPATPRAPQVGATGEDVLADWGFTPDAIDGLRWALSLGGLTQLIRRSEQNLRIVSEWVETSPWAGFLAKDPANRSCTSICLRLTDPDVTALSEEAQAAFAARIFRVDIGRQRNADHHLKLVAFRLDEHLQRRFDRNIVGESGQRQA